MSPQTGLRRVLFGNLMLIAALGGMLVQQRWAHEDSDTTIDADQGDRQVTLRDSLMSLPGFVTVDSAIIRTAFSIRRTRVSGRFASSIASTCSR